MSDGIGLEQEEGDLASLAAAVTTWQELGRRYGDQVKAIGSKPQAATAIRATSVDQLLRLGDRRGARDLVLAWLHQELTTLPEQADPETLFSGDLLRCLADVVETTSDQPLLEQFWQGLERFSPPPPPEGLLPLVGVPVLNRPDLLERLLASLDVPVQTLAIVDNSSEQRGVDAEAMRCLLGRLEREGLPGVQQVRIARPFGNAGVASAWNQILLGFPDASLALIVNNDVAFPPGVLGKALELIDSSRAQFLPLLPDGQAFSAFLITARTWDTIGLFDDNFHPAYCEDMDYRDRLLSTVDIDIIDGTFAHEAMATLNQFSSATVASDLSLAKRNSRSYQLNRLWYLHRRRHQMGSRGCWRRRWLNHWR